MTMQSNNNSVKSLHDHIDSSADSILMTFNDVDVEFASYPTGVLLTANHPQDGKVTNEIENNMPLHDVAHAITELTKRDIPNEDLSVSSGIFAVERALNDLLSNPCDYTSPVEYSRLLLAISRSNGSLYVSIAGMTTTITYSDMMLHVQTKKVGKYCLTEHFGKATGLSDIAQYIYTNHIDLGEHAEYECTLYDVYEALVISMNTALGDRLVNVVPVTG